MMVSHNFPYQSGHDYIEFFSVYTLSGSRNQECNLISKHSFHLAINETFHIFSPSRSCRSGRTGKRPIQKGDLEMNTTYEKIVIVHSYVKFSRGYLGWRKSKTFHICIQLLLCFAGILFCQGTWYLIFSCINITFWFVRNYVLSNSEGEWKRVTFSKKMYQTLTSGPLCKWYETLIRQIIYSYE